MLILCHPIHLKESNAGCEHAWHYLVHLSHYESHHVTTRSIPPTLAFPVFVVYVLHQSPPPNTRFSITAGPKLRRSAQNYRYPMLTTAHVTWHDLQHGCCAMRRVTLRYVLQILEHMDVKGRFVLDPENRKGEAKQHHLQNYQHYSAHILLHACNDLSVCVCIVSCKVTQRSFLDDLVITAISPYLCMYIPINLYLKIPEVTECVQLNFRLSMCSEQSLWIHRACDLHLTTSCTTDFANAGLSTSINYVNIT